MRPGEMRARVRDLGDPAFTPARAADGSEVVRVVTSRGVVRWLSPTEAADVARGEAERLTAKARRRRRARVLHAVTLGEVQRIAGRHVTDEEAERIAVALSHSSIRDAVVIVVDACLDRVL